MKKLITSTFLCLTLGVGSQAQGLSVHIDEAGTLSTLIHDADKYSVRSLKVTGLLNGTDIRLLRDLGGGGLEADASEVGVSTPGRLQNLNLGDARIVSGGEVYHAMNQITKDDTIGNNMFENCTSLVSVVLPKSAKSVRVAVFKGCKALRSAILPPNIDRIAPWMFEGTSIEKIELPAGIKTIPTSAFNNCARLSSIAIPESVVSIGSYAFSGCKSLRSVSLPPDLKNISSLAFSESGLREVVLPESLREIGMSAFSSCTDMKSVTVNGDLDGFGGYAFRNTTGIQAIHVRTTVPPTFSIDLHPFDNIDTETCTLFVPKGGTATYRSDVQWGCFKNIVEETATSIDNVTATVGKTSEKVYDVNGRLLPQRMKGLNIIRTSDGKVKKIYY